MNISYRLLITIILTFLYGPLHAATYTTFENGDWSDVVSVWSLDGTTPCGCSPGVLTNNDTIVLNHDISSNVNVDLTNGSHLVVNAGGSYTSAFVLSLINSSGSVEGNVSVKKFTLDGGSDVDVNSAVLTVTSRIEVYGTVNVDGGYFLMTGGNLNIYSGAEFNMTNAAKVDVQNGNISNAGTVNICNTCCFTTTGNWTNENSGTIAGGGAASTTSGNMKNFGSWSFAVAWCSAGSSTGMPLFENCVAANAICSIIVLPVEFGEISAEIDGVPVISWTTVSERDNDYFNVLRTSGDGEWTIVGTVDGAGNSTVMRSYSFADAEAPTGTLYYRIEQVDNDGNSSQSDVVSVNYIPTGATIHPNPIDRNSVLVVNNLSGAKSMFLSDIMGQPIAQIPVSEPKTAIALSNYLLTAGIYVLTIDLGTFKETHRISVR